MLKEVLQVEWPCSGDTYMHGISLGRKAEGNFSICDSIDGSTGYYTKWSKAATERQIPYGFTYIENLKNKINDQTKLKQT